MKAPYLQLTSSIRPYRPENQGEIDPSTTMKILLGARFERSEAGETLSKGLAAAIMQDGLREANSAHCNNFSPAASRKLQSRTVLVYHPSDVENAELEAATHLDVLGRTCDHLLWDKRLQD
ncbi:hypothetical protein EJB05_20081, partial [Eragrostis curvula]